MNRDPISFRFMLVQNDSLVLLLTDEQAKRLRAFMICNGLPSGIRLRALDTLTSHRLTAKPRQQLSTT
jgi:hypothetical protein